MLIFHAYAWTVPNIFCDPFVHLELQSVGATGNLEQLIAEEQRLSTELQLLEQEPVRT